MLRLCRLLGRRYWLLLLLERRRRWPTRLARRAQQQRRVVWLWQEWGRKGRLLERESTSRGLALHDARGEDESD